MPAPSPQPPAPDFWLEAEPETLLDRLADPDLQPDAELFATLRDRAAAHLMSEPAFADAISLRMQQLLRRHAGTLGGAGRAHAWRVRAEACLFTGRPKLARKAYERACAAAESAGERGLLGQLLVGRIHLLSLLGETERARELGRRAERLLREADDLPYLAKLHMNRGNAHYQQDRYAAALEAYAEAARAFESLGQRDATWVGLMMNQAIACTNLSRVDRARELFLATEAECVNLGLDSLLAHARFNRAYLESLRGNYRRALALLEQAGEVFAAQEQNDMLAAAQRSRAEIYLELGLADEALELVRQALAGFEAEGMELDASLARLDGAQCLMMLGRPAEAAEDLAATLAVYRRRRMRPRIAQTLALQARAALSGGEAADALRLARRALRIFTNLAQERGERETRFLLAECLLALDRHRDAGAALAPLASSLRRLASGERILYHGLRGRIARRRQRPREAGRELDRALAALEAQRQLIPGAELRTRAFDRHSALYGERIGVLLDARRPRFAAIFPLVERARARGFRERVALRGAAPAAEQEDRATLASLTRRLEDAEFQSGRERDQEEIERLRRRTLALEGRILRSVRRGEALSAAGRRLGAAAEVAAIAGRLERDECLLQYFIAERRVLALLVNQDGGTLVTLPEDADGIRHRCENLSFQLNAAALAAGGPGGDLGFLLGSTEQALTDLHDVLLAPLGDVLPASGRLTLVPHEFLHGVPFECLHDGAAYLDERYRVARTPNADFLLRRGKGRPRSRGRTLVAGAVRVGPAEVRAEIDGVAACFAAAGRRCELLVDPSREELLAALPACRHLHLSTHGQFRVDNPHFSRLATDDGAIFLADVAGQDLAAELVVLSACESGEVLAARGDELAGVAHGFMAAGARQMLASRWRVHDLATREYMQAFYRDYLSGRRRDAVASARAAARTLRETRPHPFFWGGFSVYGT